MYTKDAKVYGQVRGTFRHKWWNYYERGLSFADGRFFEEAARDFKRAIDKREKDQRMARTYGMHFVDYFPHRELGIVYYQTGNLEAAKKELTLSLSQYSTSKAQFYLDRVRKGLMERKGGPVARPRLIVDLPEGDLWTREDPVVISGTVRDKHFVSAVTIKGQPLFMEGAKQVISFREPLELVQGSHTVEVEAANLLGKTSKRSVVIHVDRQGPIITVEGLISDPYTPKQGPMLRGSIYDEAGVAQLMVNGRAVPIQRSQEVHFDEELPPGFGAVEVVAVDSLGNRTSAYVDSDISSFRRKPLMIACADPQTRGLLVAGLFSPKDTEPPRISLKGWADSDVEAVYMDKLFLDGGAADEGIIESLTLNQKSIMRGKGKRIFFNQVVHLQKGKNAITIKAKDKAGNVATRELMVIRKIPKALQLAARLSMTVFPFEQKGTVSDAGHFFQGNLTDALVNRNRFRIIEREKLDTILQEQKLSRSKLIDKRTALKLGKLVAAQTIVAGDIIESGIGVEIVGRVIDTETSEILASEDVYDEIKDLHDLQTLAEGMAIRIHRSFPLLNGTVIKEKGKWIFVDIGDDRIDLRHRLIVYHEEPVKHPVTGKLLGADNEIMGRARVVQVMPGMSKAEMMDGRPASIKPLDKVISE
ncbi:MAG: CsgG/HfaB family protein [Desulfatiglandaceae bacterium]